MTRRLRLGLRAALVAALTTTMTISPVSAGWLLDRLAGNSNGAACCVTTWQAPACPPPPCCPPPACCPVPPEYVYCDDVYAENYGVPSDGVIYDDAAPLDQQPPAPAEAEGPAESDSQEPPVPSEAERDQAAAEPRDEEAAGTESPSDAGERAPVADEPEGDAEDAPETSDVPTPPVAPSPFDQPEPADEPEPFSEEPEAADQPLDAPEEQPELEAEDDDDLFDFDEPTDDEPSEAIEAPEEDDFFGDAFDAREDELPPATDAPADDAVPADDAGGLFDAFGEPSVDDATDEGAVEGAVEGALEAGEDLFNELLDDADEPVSTDAQEEGKAPADSDDSSIFDELFGHTTPAAPVLTVTVAATKPVATAMDATESRLWIDNTGHFSTEGRLVAITDTHVRLLKSNGRTCTVELRRLSPSDAAYVAEVAEQITNDADLLAVAK